MTPAFNFRGEWGSHHIMMRALRPRAAAASRFVSPRRGTRLVAAVAVAVALAGCNYDPAYVDPLAGLAKVPAASVPQDVPVTVQEPVALVPSENSAMVLQAVEEWKQTTDAKMVKALVSDEVWDDGNPQHLVDGVVGVLRKHYPKAELVDDLATAKKRGFRTTVVADIQYHHLVTAFDTNHVTLTYVVMNADETPISRFSGEGTSHGVYGSTDPHFRDAVAMAVANLDAKAAQLLQGSGGK
jgi:hypothetical protein